MRDATPTDEKVFGNFALAAQHEHPRMDAQTKQRILIGLAALLEVNEKMQA